MQHLPLRQFGYWLVTRTIVVFATLLITISCAVIFLQDSLIVPSTFKQYLASLSTVPDSPPGGFIEYNVPTAKGGSLQIWKTEARNSAHVSRQIAIIFHGSSDTLLNVAWLQSNFAEWGIASYRANYRGVGSSSGWPSETGFYEDADTLWDFVAAQEHVDKSHILIAGFSLGSGPAAYLAAQKDPGTLVLVSAYASIRAVIEERPGLLRYFLPFLRYDLPTAKFVSKLENTCVILFHGVYDNIVPFSNFMKIKDSYRGKFPLGEQIYERGTHLLFSPAFWQDLSQQLHRCAQFIYTEPQ